jgi:hypothetical protein
MQRPTNRDASSACVFPQALKKSPPPPNVPVPKLSTGTFNPDAPNCLYSIVVICKIEEKAAQKA